MEAPNLPSFFKSGKSKRFNYRPFYYDKEKEERALRRKRYAHQEGDAIDNTEKSYHSDFNSRWTNANSVRRIKTNSNQRLIFIIVGLSALAWWFYRDLLLN